MFNPCCFRKLRSGLLLRYSGFSLRPAPEDNQANQPQPRQRKTLWFRSICQNKGNSAQIPGAGILLKKEQLHCRVPI